MAARLAESKSADLIDFQLARNLHSKEQNAPSKPESFVEFESRTPGEIEIDQPRASSSKDLANTLIARARVAASESETGVFQAGAEHHVGGPIVVEERSLRRIEAQLADLNARLVALSSSPQSIAGPDTTADVQARSQSDVNWPLRWVDAAAESLLTKTADDASTAKAIAWQLGSLQTGRSWPDRETISPPAHRLELSLFRGLAFVGLLALTTYFLLPRPAPVETSQTSQNAKNTREWPAPNVQAAAAGLRTHVDSFSPAPISDGASDPQRRPSATAGEPPASASGSITPAPTDAVVQHPVTASAEGDDAEAQYNHATELYKLGDVKGAVTWLEKSAKQGNDKATLELGILYMQGRLGFPRNFTQARKWLEMAANNGNALAMHNLAVLYNGGEGRRPDYARASDWFRRAAERGIVDSMFNLGIAYTDGLGVEKDFIQAYAWFSVAASRGDAKAAQKRNEIGKILDHEELYEGKILADSLKFAERESKD